MARLIDGTKATKEVMEYSRKLHEAGNVDAAGYVMWAASIVGEQPTIEADPVKHGKWVYKSTSEYDGYIVCSICDVYLPSHKLFGKDDEYTNTSNYCPHCGARMGKE